MKPLAKGSSFAVIGAGIIGTGAAYVLNERGYRVTLFDRAEPGRTGPSFGNAGHVVGSGIFPLAEPGIALAGMKMLTDPEGALKIPPAYLGKITPWLWRFWRASYGEAYERGIRALIGMNRGAVEDTEALWGRAGISHMLKRSPALYLYESEASWTASRGHWKRRIAEGFASSFVDAAAIRELEPSLAPIFPRGVLSEDWAIVTDPFEVVTGLFEAGSAHGVVHQRVAVTAVVPDGDGVSVVADGTSTRFDAALIAAGVWSKPLAEGLGENLPVEAERGYNLTFPGHQAAINRPLVFSDRGVVATSLTPGLRLGGWTELGGTELPPNPSRWKKMAEIAGAVLPELASAEGDPRMGHRPSVPDSVPVISRSGKHPSVFYAVGHGHYGLSQSAKTANMIGELVAEAADGRYQAHSIARFT